MSLKTEIQKNQTLLLIVAVLLLLKILVEPLINWQNQQIAVNANLAKKATKSEAVLAQQQQLEALKSQVTAHLQQLTPLYYPYQSDTQFKLTQQQRVEEYLNKHQIKVSNIGWQALLKLDQQQLIRHQMLLSLQGKTTDLIALMQELETLTPRINIVEFNVSLKGQDAESLGRVDGNARLVFYMQQEVK